MITDKDKSRKYDEILTIEDLMDFLAIGRSTAYGLLRTGKIKSFKIGHIYKIPKENMLQYVTSMQKK